MLSASKFSHLPGGSIHAGLNSVAVFEQLHSLHLAWIRLASTRAASVACNCPKPEPFKKWRLQRRSQANSFPFYGLYEFLLQRKYYLPSWRCCLLPPAFLRLSSSSSCLWCRYKQAYRASSPWHQILDVFSIDTFYMWPGPKARMRLYSLYMCIIWFLSIFFKGHQMFRISESGVLYDESKYSDFLVEDFFFPSIKGKWNLLAK